MIADNNNGQKWYGNENLNADQDGKVNDGVATESKGREDNPELYENDVLDKVSKRKKDDIWSRGNEKRVKYKEDE